MRYLDATTTDKPVSRIGLGTWQFGSREWGYGDRYSTDAGMVAEVGVSNYSLARWKEAEERTEQARAFHPISGLAAGRQMARARLHRS